MSGGGIEAVLAAHVIESVGGGTATGSHWRCRCGATKVIPGTRDNAAHRGTEHVAAAVLAWLDARLTEGDVIEAVAAAVRHDLKTRTFPPDPITGRGGLGLTEHDIASTALTAVRGVLSGEGS